jgi:hydroxymethylpyrimidine pyrophosphatase-like HAD family hydrolase
MHPIDREDCRRIAEKAILLDSHVCVQIFTDDAIYEINPSQRDDPASILEQIPIVKLPFDEVPGTFLKFILAHTPEHLDKLIDNLDLPRICGGLSSFKSSDVYIEFVAAGVSKGKALSDVRKRCKDAKKILAIGDYENDLEMISRADVGGAPSNAIAPVRRAANVVVPVDNNHGAIARFLETVL